MQLLPLLLAVGLVSAVPTPRDSIMEMLNLTEGPRLESVTATPINGHPGHINIEVCAANKGECPPNGMITIWGNKQRTYTPTGPIQDERCYKFTNVETWTKPAMIVLQDSTRKLSELIEVNDGYAVGTVYEYKEITEAQIVLCKKAQDNNKLIRFTNGHPTDSIFEQSCFESEDNSCLFKNDETNVEIPATGKACFLQPQDGDNTKDVTKLCQNKPIKLSTNSTNQISVDGPKINAISYYMNELEMSGETGTVLLFVGDAQTAQVTCVPDKKTPTILKCGNYKFKPNGKLYSACVIGDGNNPSPTFQDLTINVGDIKVSGDTYFSLKFISKLNDGKYEIFNGKNTGVDNPAIEVDCTDLKDKKCFAFLKKPDNSPYPFTFRHQTTGAPENTIYVYEKPSP